MRAFGYAQRTQHRIECPCRRAEHRGIGGGQHGAGRDNGNDGEDDRCQPGCRVAAERACDARHREGTSGAGENRQDAHSKGRVAEHRCAGANHPRQDGRVVEVACGEIPGPLPVVGLVRKERYQRAQYKAHDRGSAENALRLFPRRRIGAGVELSGVEDLGEVSEH